MPADRTRILRDNFDAIQVDDVRSLSLEQVSAELTRHLS